jgi:hypothetical protein
MTGTRLRRPKPSDLQRALAFITAIERGNEDDVVNLWDDTRDRLMLACALATCARNPDLMRQALNTTDKTARIVNLARLTEIIAAKDGPNDDDDDDDDEDDWPPDEDWERR